QIAVVVDIHHRHTTGPSVGADSCLLGDVLEPHVSFVQVQAARDHVAGKEDVGEPIVVDITYSYPGAVIDIDVGLNIQGVISGDGVRESDAGLVGTQKFEQRLLAFSAAACQPEKRDRE